MPEVISSSGWGHANGRFTGYVCGPVGALRFELGARAFNARETDRRVAKRGNMGAMLAERARLGVARAGANPEISLHDAYAPQHERRAGQVDTL